MVTPLNKQLSILRRESEEREAQRRAGELGLDYVDLSKKAAEVDALKYVSEAEAKEARAVPLEERTKKIILAVFDPRISATHALINKLESKGFEVLVQICSLSALDHVWQGYKYITASVEEITGVIKIGEVSLALAEENKRSLEATNKLINHFDFTHQKIEELLSIILAAAIATRASDIHFEPEEKVVRLRFRIDGILHDIVSDFSKEIYHYAVSRIKLLSKMKLNVEAESQDGRFTISLPNTKEDEVRVSIIPSEFGETIVLRVLFATALDLSITDLGLREDDLQIVQQELKRPDGMILNTGPTGSGKTTTLYVFLRSKATSEIKVVTIEKPIEYHLPGIEQTQVDEKAGYGFAEALKSILRQDPDIILVGEINDEKTAETAVQAALTGHLVFSTVHANNAPAAIPRLLDLNVKPASIGPALNLVIAQRLIRKLCDNCKVLVESNSELSLNFKRFSDNLPKRVIRINLETATIFKAQGCEVCGGLGYKGRVGIFELFLVDTKVEEAIHSGGASESELLKLAKNQGMVSLQQDGILKAMRGLTSLEEVETATGPLIY